MAEPTITVYRTQWCGDCKWAISVVVFEDGSRLIEHSNDELAVKLGLLTRASTPFYDLVVVGSGPAGEGAAAAIAIRRYTEPLAGGMPEPREPVLAARTV